MTRFVVAIEGVTYEFAEFTPAREEYEKLKECGFHEASLRAVDECGKTLVWSPSARVFFPRGY